MITLPTKGPDVAASGGKDGEDVRTGSSNGMDSASSATLFTEVSLRFLLLLAFSMGLLFLRWDGSMYTPGKYLWAEDGNVFINEAQALGVNALWQPYAGYLLAYPRLIALLANALPLVWRPPVLLAGWFAAYLFLMTVMIRRMRIIKPALLPLLLLILTVSLQPNNGENFFNLTNSQWLLGAALCILVVTQRSILFPATPGRFILVLVLGLSGPFSVVVLPVLIFDAWRFRKLTRPTWFHLMLAGCALVQLMVLIVAPRASGGPIDAMPLHWLSAFSLIAAFGASKPSTIFVAVVFWIVLITTLAWHGKRHAGTDAQPMRDAAWLAIVVALLFVVAGEFSHKHAPLMMAVAGSGNRYSWIPYSLLPFGAMLAGTGRPGLQAVMLTCVLFICVCQFQNVSSPPLQFRSFAHFARYQDVQIPIHPQWPKFPGWFVQGRSAAGNALASLQTVHVDLNSITVTNAEFRPVAGKLELVTTTNDPMLTLNARVHCQAAADVALEVDLTRSAGGWTQVFWSATNNFNEANSLRRWYPSGAVKWQVAFPYARRGLLIRIDPAEKAGERMQIAGVTAYCLP